MSNVIIQRTDGNRSLTFASAVEVLKVFVGGMEEEEMMWSVLPAYVDLRVQVKCTITCLYFVF
jgi:hypothetical protein